MINKAMFKQVQAFKRQGYFKSAIVKALDLDPKTVAKYFAMEEEDYRAYRQDHLFRDKAFDDLWSEILEVYETNGSRPLYNRKDERIEAHVLLCYLSLFLVRIAERETGETWDHIRSVMERCHLGEFSSKDGRLLQRTELTAEQINILNRLKIAHPPAPYDVQLRPKTVGTRHFFGFRAIP